MDAFWHNWLCGLSQGLHTLNPSARDAVLSACGRACATPEVLPRMRALLMETADVHSFLRMLGQQMPGIQVMDVQPGQVYDFIYNECGCPLHTEQGLTDGLLCECSRHSLGWVMGELFPDTPPQVTLLEGILQGDRQCRLRVTFPSPLRKGHVQS